MHDHDHKNQTSSAALALLAGAAIGAITALLLAPKSGAEMREDLKDAAGNAKAELERKKEQLKKTADEIGETIKKNFS